MFGRLTGTSRAVKPGTSMWTADSAASAIAPRPKKLASVLITNSVGICGSGFLVQTRRERRAYPSAVCKERTTKPGPKRHAAGGLHRIWLLALLLLGHRSLRICSLVAPRQKPNAVQQMPTQFVNSTLGSLRCRDGRRGLNWSRSKGPAFGFIPQGREDQVPKKLELHSCQDE